MRRTSRTSYSRSSILLQTTALSYLHDSNAQHGAICDSNAQIKYLGLAKVNLGPDGAAAIPAVLNNRWSFLTELRIDFNMIGVIGAGHIASGLKTNQTLTSLNLHYNNIEDEGAEAMINALQRNGKSNNV